MKKTFLTCLLSFVLFFAGPASLVVSAQTGDPSAPKAREREVFILYQDENGETVCRLATPAERLGIVKRGEGLETRRIYNGAPSLAPDGGGGVDKLTANATTTSSEPAQNLLPSAGLRIILHGTPQLDQHPEAKQAFIVAANRWEALISTPITVVLDVDFGPRFFNATTDYPPGVLGSTSSSMQLASVASVRGQLLQSATGADEAALYNALPNASIPIEHGGSTTGSVSNVRPTFAAARALGLRADIANPDALKLFEGDAGIGFNSAFGFDFNPEDGIAFDKTDFDAVVVHEIGHALGFTSSAGGEATPATVSLWDMFRFRPGSGNLGTLASAPRVMASDGEQVFFNNRASTFGTQELDLSTGGPLGNSPGGDGRQSSHWKDDFFTGVFIGIMDPNIGKGQRKQVTTNDLNALDTFGYTIGGTAPQPTRPANDDFNNSVALAGPNGSATGTNIGATKQPGEPNHAGEPGGASVWYSWTAPASGPATFDTAGSNYDTMLAVYTGASLGGLSLVTANDDVQNGVIRHSIVTFNATAGTTYRIAVDGWDGETGQFNLNWTAPAQSVFSITGRIGSACCGDISVNPVGITVTLSGSQSATTTTDAAGFYRFHDLPQGGNYTVTPSKAGASFAPASATFNNLSQNQTADFTGSSVMHTVSGVVRDTGGNPLAGVNVIFVRGLVPDITQTPVQATTNAEGRFSFTALGGRDYRLLVPGYNTEPSVATFPNLSADQTVNFVASRPGLSGRVTDGDGLNVGGATVKLDVGGTVVQTATTDAEGRYSFSNLNTLATYRLTTSKAGQYNGQSVEVGSVLQDRTVDLKVFAFILISGTVHDQFGNPVSNVSVHVSDRGAAGTTGANGQFLTGVSPAGGVPVKVTLSKFGYKLSPAELSFASTSVGNQNVNIAATLGNRIDTSQFFVAQHYRDFLGREADAGGLGFWTNGIESCGSDIGCVMLKRTDTSAAFFLSIEFQETGFLVHRMYKAAFGEADGTARVGGVPTAIKVPVVRMEEFFPDSQRIAQDVIVGTAGWPERLNSNKNAFALEFVQRTRFTSAFPSNMTPAAFVDALNANAGNVLSADERANLVNELTANNNVNGRASVLRKVAEDSDLAVVEKNKAFVLMQYFGYMRRDPNGGNDTDHSGYNFWLKKLNDNGGDYHKAQMVFAFLDSIEYRDRFTP